MMLLLGAALLASCFGTQTGDEGETPGPDCRCDAERGCCDHHCVKLSNDPQHCGACDRVCQPGELCSGGSCQPIVCTARACEPRSCCGALCCGQGQACCDKDGAMVCEVSADGLRCPE